MTANTIHTDLRKHIKPGGLQSPDLMVRHLVSNVIIIFLGSMICGILAYFVMQKGSLVKWDLNAVNRMHAAALSSPAWVTFAILSIEMINRKAVKQNE